MLRFQYHARADHDEGRRSTGMTNRAVKVLFQMNFVQFSSSFAPKNGPLVQFIVQFFTIKIQEKEELSSVQVPKNQVNFMNLVL